MRRFLITLLLILPFASVHTRSCLERQRRKDHLSRHRPFPGSRRDAMADGRVHRQSRHRDLYAHSAVYPSGEAVQVRTINVTSPFTTITLTDICLNTFGRANTGGMLEIDGGIYTPEARARIYNVGNPAGQFGQGVPGIGLGRLSRQAFLYGLSTTPPTA